MAQPVEHLLPSEDWDSIPGLPSGGTQLSVTPVPGFQTSSGLHRHGLHLVQSQTGTHTRKFKNKRNKTENERDAHFHAQNL